jgi:alpha-ketoglutarate-dependent taurine dioxygenase
MAATGGPLATKPLGRFGVEIQGADAAQLLEDDATAQLAGLFDRHGLLAFRQVELDPDSQVALVTAIGRWPLTVKSGSATRYVSNVEPEAIVPWGRLLFHSDWMWTSDPLKAISLYGERVEAGVPPTFFASAVAADAGLPEELQQRLTGLTITNVNDASYGDDGNDSELLHATYVDPQSAVHPLVYPHPRTGVPLLSVSEMMTKQINGLAAAESESLLKEIYGHLYNEDNQVEHHWQEGDLVVWDNLAVQHARPNVKRDGMVRTLRRVTLGDTRARERSGKPVYVPA